MGLLTLGELRLGELESLAGLDGVDIDFRDDWGHDGNEGWSECVW